MKHKPIVRLISTITTFSILALTLMGCGKTEGVLSSSADSKYKHRVILVSDMHYTTNMSETELKEVAPDAIASSASGTAFGYTQEEKIQNIMDDIDAFNKRESIEALFVLGDLSLDDYGYRNLPDSYLQKFKKDFLDKLDYNFFALAGNHDSYPNEKWKEIMGTDRQYSVKVGDAAFIMLDTFASELASSASGSDYVGIDLEWLEQEIAKYPDETIFLCSHYYQPSAKDWKFKKLLRENERIVCMFRGHTHENTVLAAEDMDFKFLFDIGGYAYMPDSTAGTTDWNQFDDDWAWGYQVLEWNDTEVHTYHVKTSRTYTATNGVFNYVGAIEDEQVIEINKGDK